MANDRQLGVQSVDRTAPEHGCGSRGSGSHVRAQGGANRWAIAATQGCEVRQAGLSPSTNTPPSPRIFNDRRARCPARYRRCAPTDDRSPLCSAVDVPGRRERSGAGRSPCRTSRRESCGQGPTAEVNVHYPPGGRQRGLSGDGRWRVVVRRPQATTPSILRSRTPCSSRSMLARISSQCSLNSGARLGGAGVPSNCTGVVTNLNGTPAAVAVSPT